MRLIDILIVGFGGGFGAICRFAIAWGCQRFLTLAAPIGTLIANVTGCFLIGLLIGSGKADQSDTARLLLGVGFLGGLTTFSTFGAETIAHLHQGHYVAAGGNVALNVVLGLLAVALGIALGKKVSA
jgi:CrcB protein